MAIIDYIVVSAILASVVILVIMSLVCHNRCHKKPRFERLEEQRQISSRMGIMQQNQQYATEADDYFDADVYSITHGQGILPMPTSPGGVSKRRFSAMSAGEARNFRPTSAFMASFDLGKRSEIQQDSGVSISPSSTSGARNSEIVVEAIDNDAGEINDNLGAADESQGRNT